MSDKLKDLTVGEFLHTLRQVVAEKGANYVYPESEKVSISFGGDDHVLVCGYWHNGQPSCIIGHALDVLGVVVPPEMEGKGARSVLRRFGAPAPVQVMADLTQIEQDRGRTWGEALEVAEKYVRALGVSA